MINCNQVIQLDNGKTYVSFQGVSEDDFQGKPAYWMMYAFGIKLGFESARQEAHFIKGSELYIECQKNNRSVFNKKK